MVQSPLVFNTTPTTSAAATRKGKWSELYAHVHAHPLPTHFSGNSRGHTHTHEATNLLQILRSEQRHCATSNLWSNTTAARSLTTPNTSPLTSHLFPPSIPALRVKDSSPQPDSPVMNLHYVPPPYLLDLNTSPTDFLTTSSDSSPTPVDSFLRECCCDENGTLLLQTAAVPTNEILSPSVVAAPSLLGQDYSSSAAACPFDVTSCVRARHAAGVCRRKGKQSFNSTRAEAIEVSSAKRDAKKPRAPSTRLTFDKKLFELCNTYPQVVTLLKPLSSEHKGVFTRLHKLNRSGSIYHLHVFRVFNESAMLRMMLLQDRRSLARTFRKWGLRAVPGRYIDYYFFSPTLKLTYQRGGSVRARGPSPRCGVDDDGVSGNSIISSSMTAVGSEGLLGSEGALI